MSIKDLFKSSTKVLPASSYEDVGQAIESGKYIEESIKDRDRVVPDVDFSNPTNFARFASAEKYYSDAITRIYNDYPFDGSLFEKQAYHNSGSNFDHYVFENLYPRTTGYARFSPSGWGVILTQSTNLFGAPVSASMNYIQVKGGPNYTNVWDTTRNRETNLKLSGVTGNTIEFWLKKGSFTQEAEGGRQVIFDLWNSASVTHLGGSEYGRFLVYVDGTAVYPTSSIKLTYVSGTISVCTGQEIGASDGTVASSSILNDTWNHFAISAINTGSNLMVRLYLNGTLNDTRILTNGAIQEVTGALVANIGSLRVKPIPVEAVPADQGWGKLSGSLDEFRFWKVARTSEEIYKNWYCQLGVYGAGGTNTDTSNTKLGVYYKFNEGITEAAQDAVVLDYSGRLSHGGWINYNTSGSISQRSTGSAMDESGYTEFRDPIIYSFHPDVESTVVQYRQSGSYHDDTNGSLLYHNFPAWILEEDADDGKTGHLANLCQIIGTYFDELSHQIEYLPKIHYSQYGSGSTKPFSFSDRLLNSMGFDTSEIFSDVAALSQYLPKDDSFVFEEKLNNVKNLIYKNIYNNLAYIYKSKGTEKAFRNFIRCFGIDDELIKINLYGNNVTYEFRDNYRETATKRKFVDFNNADRFDATVYQYSGSSTNTVSYLSASVFEGSGSAATLEVEVIFPKKHETTSDLYFETPFLSSSLFGIHTAQIADPTDTSWAANDWANYQVYFVRDKIDSKNGYFKVTSSYGGYFPLLTSSFVYGVYDNQKWNLAVRVKPLSWPWMNLVSGSIFEYNLEFCGYNAVADQIVNQFSVSASISASLGSRILSSPKRVYVGAHRRNCSGSTIDRSDVRVSNVRYWVDYLDDGVIREHAIDADSRGVESPYENSFVFDDYSNKIFIPRSELLALHWDFNQITGSNASGQFAVDDQSSGSIETRSRFGWLSGIVGVQNSGRGDGFLANDDEVVDTEYLHSSKKKLPESLDSYNMVEISERIDDVFVRDTRPINYYISFEKSMYQTISEEMINLFAGVDAFNNLIGEPVNRFRDEYKDLNKLRSLFYERIGNTPDIEKYIEYYKWLDLSISRMLVQLVPASANVSSEIHTMIEPTILERSKYKQFLPSVESKLGDPENGLRGINELLYPWRTGHAPTDQDQSKNCLWWRLRAVRTDAPISSSVGGTNLARSAILDVITQTYERSLSTPCLFGVEKGKVLQGGLNLEKSRIDEGAKFNGYIFCSASFVQSPVDCEDDAEIAGEKYYVLRFYDEKGNIVE